MLKYVVLVCMVLSAVFAEAPIQGVKPTNVLGTSDQHASFSFVRPGLTQTAFAFSGPSSHQSFSSSVGNPYLAQRVLPNVANALAYRNPGLGVFPVGPIANGYAAAPIAPAYVSAAPAPAPAPAPYPYQAAADPAALAYYQQLQQVQQPQVQGYSAAALYQAQLAQLLALRQAQAQSQVQAQAVQTQQVHEQADLQQEEQQQLQKQEQQPQSLLGVAYSSAPSVARVKVSGNGYKFDF